MSQPFDEDMVDSEFVIVEPVYSDAIETDVLSFDELMTWLAHKFTHYEWSLARDKFRAMGPGAWDTYLIMEDGEEKEIVIFRSR